MIRSNFEKTWSISIHIIGKMKHLHDFLVKMRLIDVTNIKLVQFFDESKIPRYGILSHRWGSEELSFRDFNKLLVKRHPGYEKIKRFCQKVSKEGIQYAWIDTCWQVGHELLFISLTNLVPYSIDKTSSAELSESINSMFAWYQKAAVCFVCLADVHVKDLVKDGKLVSVDEAQVLASDFGPAFFANRSELETRVAQSEWFTRGWTLQELLAPLRILFYDAEWHFFGTKSDLEGVLASKTGVDRRFLSGAEIGSASIAKRLSWACGRVTTRVEDLAYCLLGIFGVNMPLLYGEGMRAFTRLQEEIMKDSADQSLFAWTAQRGSSENMCGPLALSPKEFADAGNIVPYPDITSNQPYAMTNQGMRIDVPTLPYPKQAGLWLAIWAVMMVTLSILLPSSFSSSILALPKTGRQFSTGVLFGRQLQFL